MKNFCKKLCLLAGISLLFSNNILSADNNQYFGAGKGTKESPFWIENAEQLQNINKFPNAYFIQTKDIDISDKEFSPICSFSNPFTGNYDGEGHRISIKELGAVDGNIKLAGIWGYTSNADIKNIIVDIEANLNLTGRVCLGAITACSNNTNISNCSISSDSNLQVKAEKCLYLGGITGYSAFNSNIKNCSFDGRIIGHSLGDFDSVCAIGGIVGENRTGSTIKQSTLSESASISGNSSIAPAWVGGIAGFNESSTYVCDCHSVVPIDIKPKYKNQSHILTLITKCNTAGTVSGYSTERIAVGGIVGFNVADISECISQGCSNTRGSIIKCEDVPSALLGGIVGDNTGKVYNSASLSNLKMLSDGFLAVGGIAGRNAGLISHCNYYSITGKGLSSFTALRSFNVFAALESVSARGGIAGINDNTYKNAAIENSKVFGNNNSQIIASYGHSRGTYGEITGLNIE